MNTCHCGKPRYRRSHLCQAHYLQEWRRTSKAESAHLGPAPREHELGPGCMTPEQARQRLLKIAVEMLREGAPNDAVQERTGLSAKWVREATGVEAYSDGLPLGPP